MPLLSEIARRKKLAYFFASLPHSACILEVGCADKWLGRELKQHGFESYTGLDLCPTADIVGDIRQWQRLGLQEESFDAIAAFELVEHVDCFREMHALLRPGGHLFLTSPVPHMDWACKTLEFLGLNQKRTSPHDHLIYFRHIPLFEPVETQNSWLNGTMGQIQKAVAWSLFSFFCCFI